MENTYEIARKIVDEFVSEGKPFTHKQVRDKIDEQGGVQRISPGFTIKNYLEKLEEKNIIVYDFSFTQYFNVEVLEKERLEYLATF